MRIGKQFQGGHRKSVSQTKEKLVCTHENMEQGRRTSPSQRKNDSEYIFQMLVGLCTDGKATWTANR